MMHNKSPLSIVNVSPDLLLALSIKIAALEQQIAKLNAVHSHEHYNLQSEVLTAEEMEMLFEQF